MTKPFFLKQERIFIIGAILYACICITFASLNSRGTEVEYITSHYSSSLLQFFSYITQIAELPGIVFFILIVLLKEKKQLLHFSLIAIATFATISFLKHIVFDTTDRPRSWALAQHIQLPDNTSNLLHFSFPSGHTAFAFCLMYCLTILFNETKWTFLFLMIGILVGASRVYLLAHFVIDTGIGALIGTTIGIAGNRLYENIVNTKRTT
jgi:membrane-associated phospholipid phosphatase